MSGPKHARVWGLGGLVLLVACVSDGQAVVAVMETTGGVESTSSTSQQQGSSTTGEPTTGEPTDDERCVQWCLSGNAQGCDSPFAGEACFTQCKKDLAAAVDGGCLQTAVDVLTCETEAPSRSAPSCTAAECGHMYAELEACTGSCTRLFANDAVGEASGGHSCVWTTTCQERQLQVNCPLDTADGECFCIVFDEAVGYCPPLEAELYDCMDIPASIVSCCADALASVEPP